ncbi:MAG: cation:dicarboxylase symporter family transporter [Rhodospirillaceae bacterium]|nr:cation:dicarboxylase symporter family transporter [Rhodospirillaceae bacterium]
MSRRFTLYILIGMIVGLLVGYLCNENADPATAKQIAGYFSILTDIFLRLIKMIIGPLVFSTLVVGIVHVGDAA